MTWRDMMAITVRRAAINTALALLVPFALEAMLIAYGEEFGAVGWATWPRGALITTSVGLLFLVRGLRIYAVPAAVLYVPVVVGAQLAFALGFACGFYGDCL